MTELLFSIVFLFFFIGRCDALISPIYHPNFFTTEYSHGVYVQLSPDGSDTFLEFKPSDDDVTESFSVRLGVGATNELFEYELNYLINKNVSKPGQYFCLRITDKAIIFDKFSNFATIEKIYPRLKISSYMRVHWRKVTEAACLNSFTVAPGGDIRHKNSSSISPRGGITHKNNSSISPQGGISSKNSSSISSFTFPSSLGPWAGITKKNSTNSSSTTLEPRGGNTNKNSSCSFSWLLLSLLIVSVCASVVFLIGCITFYLKYTALKNKCQDITNVFWRIKQ